MIDALKKNKIFVALLLFGIFYLCKKSYGNAFDFYFWKDDWAWLWSANYNPEDFYHTTVGGTWLVRTGVLMRLYVLKLHRLIQDSYQWQVAGFCLKCINSILFYFFIKSITKKKYLAVIGAFLFASYSGGIESYTWHKLNAVATGFVLLGFTFYHEFLRSLKLTRFLISYFFFICAFLSYMGRAAGLVPVAIFWGLLEIVKKDSKLDKFKVLLSVVVIALPYLLLIRIVTSVQKPTNNFYIDVFKQYDIFFGIVGNLLKNPFVRIDELGYLANLDKLGFVLGLSLFILWGLIGLVYLRCRSEKLKYTLFFIGWIYMFYFPNWIWGGGGVLTTLGSGHRYLAVAGIGVVTLWVLFISSLTSRNALIATLVLLVLNLSYSDHLISLESSVRNRYLVEPIYYELNKAMEEDDDVQLIVIDTPNKLKSFVAGGWYPYTYAYYKGLTDIKKFPVVIAFWEYAAQWVCSNPEQKDDMQAVGGFGDNRNLEYLDIEHIYAWYLDVDGKLDNKTDQIRQITKECQDKRRESGRI